MPPPATQAHLTSTQRLALVDILAHHETYAEAENFKRPEAVTGYGPPFSRATPPALVRACGPGADPSAPALPDRDAACESEPESESGDALPAAMSTSPLLCAMLSRFVLPLPGVRDLPPPFWAERVQGLLARMALAELSESYDKGALGLRKTLATGSCAVIEMVGRGTLRGIPRREEPSRPQYDVTNADDLEAAWADVVDGLVHGDWLDAIFHHVSQTDRLEEHSPAVGAAVRYAIIHLATAAHHVFVLSPEGQYLLKLLENVNSLFPYKMVKQTLRMGNAATMLNGMVRLLLTKLSVTSLTNWVGLTQAPADGMNLLQRIISLVLSWDAAEFRKSAERVEKSDERPPDEALQAIREFMTRTREEHEQVRQASQEHGQSIITAIFNAADLVLVPPLNDAVHAKCLEYYSALLSARDRDVIADALCRQQPDLFTQMIKDGVSAYEPIIRAIHARIDLREHLEAAQGFIEDFIKTSKPTAPSPGLFGVGASTSARLAGVQDYVELLMRNRSLLYKWVHDFASQCPDVWEDLRIWAKKGLASFRQSTPSRASDAKGRVNEGDPRSLDDRLEELFAALPIAAQVSVRSAIDAHAEYLSTLCQISHARLQFLAVETDTDRGTMAGPGVYLARWQDFLDETPITPATPHGPIRRGRDVKNTTTMGKTGIGEGRDVHELRAVQEEGPLAPDVSVVVKELGPGFGEILRSRAELWSQTQPA